MMDIPQFIIDYLRFYQTQFPDIARQWRVDPEKFAVSKRQQARNASYWRAYRKGYRVLDRKMA